MKRAITGVQLFDYAVEIAKENEANGANVIYPTVRQAARHFKVTQAEIELASEECVEGDRYLGLIVGYRSGSAVSGITRLGDYQIEAY